MKNIVNNSDKVKIRFNKKFYSKKSLKDVIDIFSDEADIDLKENNNSIIAIIKTEKTDISFEFCNAVLLMMKNSGEV